MKIPASKYVAVGSRVTCDPAPTNTDEDYLAFAGDVDFEALHSLSSEWTRGGSDISDDNNSSPEDERFSSYTHGRINLIVAHSLKFYNRFMAASSVAKRLNLLDKGDRVALFQAVLYGNGCTPRFALEVFPDGWDFG